MHAYTHTHTYNSIHTGLQACKYIHTHTHTHVHTHIYVHTHTHPHSQWNKLLHFCVCVCLSNSYQLDFAKGSSSNHLDHFKIISSHAMCVDHVNTFWIWNIVIMKPVHTLQSIRSNTLQCNYTSTRMGNTARDAFDWIQTNCSCHWGEYDSHFHMGLDIRHIAYMPTPESEKTPTLTFLVNIQVPRIPVNTPNSTSQIRQ